MLVFQRHTNAFRNPSKLEGRFVGQKAARRYGKLLLTDPGRDLTPIKVVGLTGG